VLVYLDIDHFKAVQRQERFPQRRPVLVLLAEMLRKEFRKTQYFVGHIAAMISLSGFRKYFNRKARADVVKLSQKFARDVLAAFYDLQDQQSGYILCTDRDGRPSRFPLATVSAAMLKLEKGCERPEIDEIGTIIARLKKIIQSVASETRRRCFRPPPGVVGSDPSGKSRRSRCLLKRENNPPLTILDN